MGILLMCMCTREHWPEWKPERMDQIITTNNASFNNLHSGVGVVLATAATYQTQKAVDNGKIRGA